MPDTDALLAGVLALLAESKRAHAHCDDCWYCCRACRHSDHALYEAEDLGEGFDTLSIGESYKPGDCTCGADEWNAKVDAMLRDYDHAEVNR